jgi:hypothetical protein
MRPTISCKGPTRFILKILNSRALNKLIKERGCLKQERRNKIAKMYLQNADWDLGQALEDYEEDQKFEKKMEVAESRFNREHFLFNKDKDMFQICLQVIF